MDYGLVFWYIWYLKLWIMDWYFGIFGILKLWIMDWYFGIFGILKLWIMDCIGIFGILSYGLWTVFWYIWYFKVMDYGLVFWLEATVWT